MSVQDPALVVCFISCCQRIQKKKGSSNLPLGVDGSRKDAASNFLWL